MLIPDCESAQLAYKERLRKAERERRLLVLVFDAAGQAPVERVNGLMDQIRQWLRGRKQRRQASHVRRPHTI